MFISRYENIKLLVGCIVGLIGYNLKAQESVNRVKWFPDYDFNIVEFPKPEQKYGPMARWWWPGNAVNSEELTRELTVLGENGFAGVEIQPLSVNLPITNDREKGQMLSWDSPEYYKHVKAVMEAALKNQMFVDMTNGSGWPAGGPFLEVNEGFQTLDYNSVEIQGGYMQSIEIPKVDNFTPEPACLMAVTAAKILPKPKGMHRKTTLLDVSSTLDLTPYIQGDSISYPFSEGTWKVIAFWRKYNNLTGSMVAQPEQGPVLDYLNSEAVKKNYEYLFGERTGLEVYYGHPFRAVFEDSYEFAVDRHITADFFSFFKEHRGYDIIPWLAVNLQKKYNYVDFKNPHAPPYFSFGTEDWRIRYDYDKTISELFAENFIQTSRNWLDDKGMVHRTQAYGMFLDMIGCAGRAGIPETESMLHQEANLKVMSSGAHLYNRPLVSAESAVFRDRAYMTTPQKLRLAVDKLFTSGVNQIVFHGIPYSYKNDLTTNMGWYPFYMGFIGFSAHLGEGTQFWEAQKSINSYISRAQYVLQSGKPKTDVLLYYPFMDLEGMPDNPSEIFTMGVIEDCEPPLNDIAKIDPIKQAWAAKVYPIINAMETKGITWEWVNDESIQLASVTKNRTIDIRGNIYQALLVPNVEAIELASAKHIETLTQQGMAFASLDQIPSKQLSFENWEKNDAKTYAYLKSATQAQRGAFLSGTAEFDAWINKELHLELMYQKQYSFLRQVNRKMSDGSQIKFLWNTSSSWQSISIQLESKFKEAYWMDLTSGKVVKATGKGTLNYKLPPYGTICLYTLTQQTISKKLVAEDSVLPVDTKLLISLNNWSLETINGRSEDIELFDWKQDSILKYSSEKGVYTTTFYLDKYQKKATYFIDMGTVYYTAQVVVNGKEVGDCFTYPYVLDISEYLHKGENQISISITPGALNGLIGKALEGIPGYEKFKGREHRVMSGGLIGPVCILKKK